MKQYSSEEQSGAKWPNFFIIGEPRSGTTTLHEWLSQHTDIYMSDVKEPHYFSEINFPEPDDEILKVTRDESEYLDLFESAGKQAIRGESSTHYMADPSSPALIHERVSDSKLIAILREPVERAYSHYLLYDRRGQQEKSFAETIEDNLSTDPSHDNLARHLVELGRHYEHVQRFLKYFDQSQLHLILFDDFKKDPKKVLQEVADFLEVDAAPMESIDLSDQQNRYMQPRSRLVGRLLASRVLMNIGLKLIPRNILSYVRTRFLLKSGKKPEIDLETKDLLRRAYLQNVKDMGQFMGRDLVKLWGYDDVI